MQRDHDFVTMADYKSDMDSLGDDAARVAAKLKHDNDQLRLLLGAVVDAAGGSIVVPQSTLNEAQYIHLRITDDPAKNGLCFKTTTD